VKCLHAVVRTLFHHRPDFTQSVFDDVLANQGSNNERFHRRHAAFAGNVRQETLRDDAAQSIRKVHDIGWQPLFFLTNVSSSVGAVIQPAGPENAVGIISATYGKDPTDPQWNDDPGMKKWRDFMNKYYPEGDQTDAGNAAGYGVASALVQVLKQCGNDLSRDNIMRQAANLRDFDGGGLLLPGITVNTSPTDYYPIQQMQLEKWDGKVWVRFGDVINGASS